MCWKGKADMNIGTIAEFFIYVNLLSWPVAMVGWVASLVQRAAASQIRINEFLHEKPDIVSENGVKTEVKGSITFEKVNFHYPETGIHALKDISFHIGEGKSLGIIGRTGSGKSTIAQVLLRNYDVSSGIIRVDGHELKNLNLGHYRRQIGYVPQDDFLFSETIGNNLFFGYQKDHSLLSIEQKKELLEKATTIADVYKDIVDFPAGFETLIGERGITLSGGQKQRVAIARAIINDPQVLMLDDCFSAIDTNTEAQILQNLTSVMRGKTSIIISHRVSTVKNCTHVIVLDAGHVVEEGNHDALMQKQGYYYMLYRKQLMEKEFYEKQKAEAQKNSWQ